jgi:hypothetical protein
MHDFPAAFCARIVHLGHVSAPSRNGLFASKPGFVKNHSFGIFAWLQKMLCFSPLFPQPGFAGSAPFHGDFDAKQQVPWEPP